MQVTDRKLKRMHEHPNYLLKWLIGLQDTEYCNQMVHDCIMSEIPDA